jgi:hypothetical protein
MTSDATIARIDSAPESAARVLLSVLTLLLLLTERSAGHSRTPD